MEGDYEELYKWIEDHTITRPKRNINRDFADAVPLVEILKHHFPKLVEVHNYCSRNSYTQKLINWETLHNKVLKKLKIHLSKKKMEQLAKAEPGAIEKLLLEVKKKVENKDNISENFEIHYLEGSRPTTPAHPGFKRGIPPEVVEKLKADLSEKSEAITILKNKVEHLENLLNIKEERIKDLTTQLQTIVNQCPKPEPTHQGSKFFGFFQSNTSVASEPAKNDVM